MKEKENYTTHEILLMSQIAESTIRKLTYK